MLTEDLALNMWRNQSNKKYGQESPNFIRSIDIYHRAAEARIKTNILDEKPIYNYTNDMFAVNNNHSMIEDYYLPRSATLKERNLEIEKRNLGISIKIEESYNDNEIGSFLEYLNKHKSLAIFGNGGKLSDFIEFECLKYVSFSMINDKEYSYEDAITFNKEDILTKLSHFFIVYQDSTTKKQEYLSIFKAKYKINEKEYVDIGRLWCLYHDEVINKIGY